MLDDSKALDKGVTDVFGKGALVQRCQAYKKRNASLCLPKSEQASISVAMIMAYREFEYKTTEDKFMIIINTLENQYPKAANLMEDLEKILIVNYLKAPESLRETLCSTNPIESVNSAFRGVIHSVYNFKDGEMALKVCGNTKQGNPSFRAISGTVL